MALIQLCSAEGLCALIRCSKLAKIPTELRDILEDPEIIKMGVTPSTDAKYLLQDYAIKMNGTFDLRFLALAANRPVEGLGKMSKSILDIEIDKDWRVRCSDWDATKLSDKQIDYAAKDAFVAVEIFKKLYREFMPSSAKTDKDSILRFCDNFSDRVFKTKMVNMEVTSESPAANSQNGMINHNKSKNIEKILKRAYSTRAKPLYDNCLLQAPDGVLLCTCDRKKAEWYVEKGLGIEISNETAFTVRLNFEPAGRAVGEVGAYYQSVKLNRCVVCGKESDLVRRNVVPREYRKHFPNVMKDKTSHDVLLMCLHCHQLSNISDINLRKSLGIICNAPIYEVPEDHNEVQNFKNIQKQARALVCQAEKIPEERKIELRKNIQKQFPNEDLSQEFLEELLSSKFAGRQNSEKPSHGELVVDHFRQNEGIVNLEKMWRQHFLDFMRPRFLPNLWNVNHNANRLEIRATEGRVDPADLKIAGVDAIVIPKIEIHEPEPVNEITTVQESNIKDDDIDSSYDFHSAAGSRMDSDRTLTEDEYSSDLNIVGAGVFPKTEIHESEIVREAITLQEGNIRDDDIDSSSDFDFRSAAGSRMDNDRTLTEDEHYYSDATVGSYYETIRSDGSQVDLSDFQSFESSLTQRADNDSDDSSLGTPNFSMDSDTEVEEDVNELKN